MFEVDTYLPGDVFALRKVLRSSDVKYLLQVTRTSPTAALIEAFDAADIVYTLHRKGEVVALLGVTGSNVFLQTSCLTDGHAIAVIRAGKKVLGMLPERPLYCIVPRDDKRVRMLCKALGFTEQSSEYENYNNTGIPHVALWRTV